MARLGRTARRLGTPPAVLTKVSQDAAALKTPDMVKKLTTFGSIPAPNSPA